MAAVDILNLAVGVVQIALAVIIFRFLGRFGRTYPWLFALTAFFALRGVSRLYYGFTDNEPHAFTIVVDGVVLGTLVLLLWGLDRTVRGLESAERSAKERQAEYDRALSDYRTLMSHRIANPLSVIAGGLETLARRELPPEQEADLIDTMRAEARRLEQVTGDPAPQGPEERTLEPEPRVERV